VAPTAPGATAAPTTTTSPPGTAAPSVNTIDSPAITKPTDPSAATPTDRIRSNDPTTDPSSVRPADRIRPSDSTTTPNDPSTRPDSGGVVRPGDTPVSGNVRPNATGVIDDPEMRKNEANFNAAREKCAAIVSKDSQSSCMQDAETNYRKGRP
jgi:hypothetical protein